MGHFKNWLEGWGIDYQQLPSDLTDNYGNLKTKTSIRNQAMDSLYKSPFITFDSQKDRPEDFVNIEPLMQAKNLFQFNLTGKQILPSWEGATIYYGFRFSTPQEKISQEKREEMLRMQNEVKNLKTQLKKVTMKTLSPLQRKIVDEEWEIMKDRNNMTPEGYEKYLPIFVNNRLKKENQTGLSWTKIQAYLKRKREKGDSAYKLKKIISEKEEIIEKYRIEIENKNTFLNAVERAFLKKMKHPSTSEDQAFSHNFIKTAVDHFVRLNNRHYEYILYPESSSNMNEQLALELALKIGAEPINGFKKLENPTIDTHNYAAINKPDPNQRGLGGPDDTIYKNLYGNRGLQNTIQSSKGEIKKFTFGKQFRSFVRNWEMQPGLKGSEENQKGISIKNKRLLVIDDNVDSGGTFQAINHILVKHKPRRIDYYAPIVANFHS
jgi:hypothetical protein